MSTLLPASWLLSRISGDSFRVDAWMPSVSRIRAGNMSTSLTGARSTKNTPSAKPSAASAAA
jgi:hypothetical protein